MSIVELQKDMEKKLITKSPPGLSDTGELGQGFIIVFTIQASSHPAEDPAFHCPLLGARLHTYIFIIYTHPVETRELFPLHGFLEQLSTLLGQAATSLFPWTHICVNGHAVIGSIAQFLFTYLGCGIVGQEESAGAGG